MKKTIENLDINKINLTCIYSLPRSGSTALIAELDCIEGVVSLPESYFPQVLELLSPEERADPFCLAAFFLASSPSGALLSFQESLECMVPTDFELTFKQLGLAVAEKTKRDPSKIKTVIWKTTRIIGRWKLFSEAGGRFIILRRNPINVFDSQFRVDFGRFNRNTLRFSAFRESYEAIFSRMSADLCLSVEYELIPDQLPKIKEWLGVQGEKWVGVDSSVAQTHGKNEWHNGVMDGFESKDEIKRKNVSAKQLKMLEFGQKITRPFRPILGMLRDYYDSQIMKQIRKDADEIMERQATNKM